MTLTQETMSLWISASFSTDGIYVLICRLSQHKRTRMINLAKYLKTCICATLADKRSLETFSSMSTSWWRPYLYRLKTGMAIDLPQLVHLDTKTWSFGLRKTLPFLLHRLQFQSSVADRPHGSCSVDSRNVTMKHLLWPLVLSDKETQNYI